jgi:hypothetical protein
MFWIDSKRGYLTDWLTQIWVKLTGQRLDPDSCPWLDGASGPTKVIGLEAFQHFIVSKGLSKTDCKDACGILPSFDQLSSQSFNHQDIDGSVIDFYESTSDFSINLRAEWCWLFRPGGWLLSKLFSQRLQQLNVPLSNDDIGEDMTNDVQHWIDPESNSIELALWLRSFKQSGTVAYSGSYSTCFLESTQMNCVKVVFPLPNGRAVVILRVLFKKYFA